MRTVTRTRPLRASMIEPTGISFARLVSLEYRFEPLRLTSTEPETGPTLALRARTGPASVAAGVTGPAPPAEPLPPAAAPPSDGGVDAAWTVVHGENSEVSPEPFPEVAVAVTTVPTGTSKGRVKLFVPSPGPTTVKLSSQRYVSPSPLPEPSQADTENTAIR